MRVLLSCLQARRRHPIAAYDFWETYFKRGIEEAGWEWAECKEVDWAEPLGYASHETDRISQWQEEAWSRLLDFVRQEHSKRPFDVFLGYLYPRHIEPQAIAELQRLNIPCVNFFCDNVREYRRVPDEYRCFDLHWVPEFKALPMYREAGLRCIHAAMPVWIPIERRQLTHEERYPPTFIGGRDVQREALFADVLRLGAQLRLRGPGWLGTQGGSHQAPVAVGRQRMAKRIANQRADLERFGVIGLAWKMTYRLRRPVDEGVFAKHVDPAVFGDAYADVTQQASITLGVNRYPSYYHPFARPGTYSRLRDIEAPMLGACYLTEWTEGLDEMYEIGTEIEAFTSPEDLVDKVARLGRDSQRRAAMRQRGQSRALSEHSVPRSLFRLADALDLRK